MVIRKPLLMAGIQVRTGFSVQVPLKECLRKEIPSSIFLYLRIVNLNIGLRQIKML